MYGTVCLLADCALEHCVAPEQEEWGVAIKNKLETNANLLVVPSNTTARGPTTQPIPMPV